ncbi:hypothetical protein [Psychrobacillus sp. FSL H8-0510]|uniref:hypothetical protein n=1 Tax=Psychrobacillus sp. FSL H8-0510 TaxID=2921394 RepID=UPI0030FA4CDD
MTEKVISKSKVFRMIRSIPFDVTQGMEIQLEGDTVGKLTKIKSVKFLDMRSIEIIGLVKII